MNSAIRYVQMYRLPPHPTNADGIATQPVEVQEALTTLKLDVAGTMKSLGLTYNPRDGTPGGGDEQTTDQLLDDTPPQPATSPAPGPPTPNPNPATSPSTPDPGPSTLNSGPATPDPGSSQTQKRRRSSGATTGTTDEPKRQRSRAGTDDETTYVPENVQFREGPEGSLPANLEPGNVTSGTGA